MNFKIDTREKFTVITPLSDFLADNLTAEFFDLVQPRLKNKINLIINFKNVFSVNDRIVKQIAALHEQFYEQNISFVLCELEPSIKKVVEDAEFDNVLNITPSETEAWDIVQMEEIERELLNDGEI